MSSDGNYVVGSRAPLTRKGVATTFRYSDEEGIVLLTPGTLCGGVNTSGDTCTLQSLNGVDTSYLYMRGDGAEYGLIDLTAQLGYSSFLTSITRRDDSGFPWMSGVAYINGERHAVLIYPVPRP